VSRKILHLDLDAFFCSVEELKDPELREKPFAVGGRPQARGVVSSCSYPARLFGIHSAMPMATAVRLCPELIIVPPHFDAYRSFSCQVMDTLSDLSPLVEQISIDEAFLDVSDLPEAPELIARKLQQRINRELGLPCSIGTATNKLVAKIANNVGKSEVRSGQAPNAVKVVPPGEEAVFLAPLPVGELWGIGPKTAEKLASSGIYSVGDLARISQADLERLFGRHGQDLFLRARGIDNRPVEIEHEVKSISNETTFEKDVNDAQSLRRTLRRLVEQTGRRLRQQDLAGHTVKIKVRWSDFTTVTRQLTLENPTNLDSEIFEAADRLFQQTWPEGKMVRLVGVGVSGLQQPCVQLALWDRDSRESDQRLQSALDMIRDKYGSQAVRRGSDMKTSHQPD
jgi:DNA polymerase-4